MKKIDERITELRIEQATLQQQHEMMISAHQDVVKQFQERVAANQNRFQQIAGAIAELEALRNGETPPSKQEESKDGKRK